MAALWMLAAGALFSAMGVFVKLGASHFTSAEMVFYRSAIGLAAMLAAARWRSLPLATSAWRLHLTRSLAGLVSLLLYFYCITRLPLAAAVTLNYTSPLFLALLTALRLGERPPPALLAALALGFGGVVLVLRPVLSSDQLMPSLMGLASGALAALAYFSVRQLGERGEPEWRVVFYFVLVSTVLSGAWVAAGPVSPVHMDNWWMLLGLGLSALVAQLAMTRAFQSSHSLVAGSLSYSTLAVSALLGAVIFDDRLAASSWAGIGLIVASGLLALRRSRP
jgi:drug/metabolite transporter (DMT)-like permease